MKSEVLTMLKPKTRTAIMAGPSLVLPSLCCVCVWVPDLFSAFFFADIHEKEIERLMGRVDKLDSMINDALEHAPEEAADEGGGAGGGGGGRAGLKKEKQAKLFELYQKTGEAKLKAACQYITDLVASGAKFLVFAHHQVLSRLASVCLL
jgi:hypothetical protein